MIEIRGIVRRIFCRKDGDRHGIPLELILPAVWQPSSPVEPKSWQQLLWLEYRGPVRREIQWIWKRLGLIGRRLLQMGRYQDLQIEFSR